jgi:hypothetical protein
MRAFTRIAEEGWNPTGAEQLARYPWKDQIPVL